MYDIYIYIYIYIHIMLWGEGFDYGERPGAAESRNRGVAPGGWPHAPALLLSLLLQCIIIYCHNHYYCCYELS